MEELIRKTRSVCPECLKSIPARLMRQPDGSILLEKSCGEHGKYRVPVWRGRIDFDAWTRGCEPLKDGGAPGCPDECGLCPEHESDTCCVLLEVTGRCDLHCRFCFADGLNRSDPGMDDLKAAVDDIVSRCSRPLLQLSGGEPTLRDDLDELIRYAKQAGCSYVQLNTNGLRLARDADYASRLAQAGLDIVFLQFDGTRDDIYTALRGEPLLETKLKAIEVCSQLRLGVTLVDTVVRGVNDDDLGSLIALAASLSPAVRAVHFQPVSFFGRYPDRPAPEERYTLDQLIADVGEQARLPLDSFLPSQCDHPLCGFHSDYLIEPDGSLTPLSSVVRRQFGRKKAEDNREYVARRWSRQDQEPEPKPGGEPKAEMDFDTFLYRLRNNRLTVSAMAFQDAENLNIERLRRCSMHVYRDGKIIPFCSRYLSPMKLL